MAGSDFPDWYPSLLAIAALVPTHAVDTYPDPAHPSSEANGVPGPVFSEDTTPTLDQVKTFLASSGALVAMRAGDLTSAGRQQVAADAVALRVAASIELAAPTTDLDRYSKLIGQFKDTMDSLLSSAPDGSPGTSGPSYVPSPYLPSYAFPEPVPWGDYLL